MVGVPDDGDPDGAAEVVVVGDGRVLASLRAVYGRATPLSATITGVLRLEVRVTGSPGGSVVLGDLQLTGGPDAVDRLGARG